MTRTGFAPLRTLVVLLATFAGGCATSHATFEPPRSAWPSGNPTSPSGRATKAEPLYHTVAKGETLYRIAKNYDVTIAELARANKLGRKPHIKVGQRLLIPGKFKEVEPPADASADDDEEDADAPQTVSAAPVRPIAPGLFAWPIENGPVNSRYGVRGARNHAGIDIGAPIGTPVLASRDGEVTFAGRQGKYGQLVVLTHEDGTTTMYGHLKKIEVKQGKQVKQGDEIGECGRTGNATGPHLHFEIRNNGVPVDPMTVLP